jgi:HlyD family secretion protein
MKRAIITVITLAVLVGGGWFLVRSFSAGASKDKIQYRIAKVETDLVKKTVTATGVLKPWTVVDIRSRAGGRVEDYAFDEIRYEEMPDEEKAKYRKDYEYHQALKAGRAVGPRPFPRLSIEEGSIVRKGQTLLNIDRFDTLLRYDQAQADIAANKARIEQTSKEYALQQQQVDVAIQTAKANLAAAQANEEAAKARYESAREQANAQQSLTEASIENAKATLAAEEARLAQMTSATQKQRGAAALSAYNQALANLKNAEVQLKRQKALLEKGYIAASQVDQAQATYDVAKANVDSANEVVNTVLPELTNDLKAQQARVKQAQAALASAEASRVDIALRQQSAAAALADYKRSQADRKQAEAQLRQAQANRINNAIRITQIAQARADGTRARASLANAQIQLDETRVTAPSDGIILTKYIEEGTLIPSGVSAMSSAGSNIVQLGDITRMYVEVQVDETDVAAVDVDQKVDITFDAYPTLPFEGKVIKIDPKATVEQNVTTVRVRVEVDNSAANYRLLKPGMNASCEFIIEKKPDVLAVPNEALKTDTDNTRYVEIAEGGKVAPTEKGEERDENLLVDVKVVKRPVKVGLEGNDMTEIKEGLQEGETIITQTIEPTPPTPGGNPFGGSRGPGRR